jgi:hypothetical protein
MVTASKVRNKLLSANTPACEADSMLDMFRRDNGSRLPISLSEQYR